MSSMHSTVYFEDLMIEDPFRRNPALKKRRMSAETTENSAKRMKCAEYPKTVWDVIEEDFESENDCFVENDVDMEDSETSHVEEETVDADVYEDCNDSEYDSEDDVSQDNSEDDDDEDSESESDNDDDADDVHQEYISQNVLINQSCIVEEDTECYALDGMDIVAPEQFTEPQLRVLYHFLLESPTPSEFLIQSIADHLNLSVSDVEAFFENSRIQLENDHEDVEDESWRRLENKFVEEYFGRLDLGDFEENDVEPTFDEDVIDSHSDDDDMEDRTFSRQTIFAISQILDLSTDVVADFFAGQRRKVYEIIQDVTEDNDI